MTIVIRPPEKGITANQARVRAEGLLRFLSENVRGFRAREDAVSVMAAGILNYSDQDGPFFPYLYKMIESVQTMINPRWDGSIA